MSFALSAAAVAALGAGLWLLDRGVMRLPIPAAAKDRWPLLSLVTFACAALAAVHLARAPSPVLLLALVLVIASSSLRSPAVPRLGVGLALLVLLSDLCISVLHGLSDPARRRSLLEIALPLGALLAVVPLSALLAAAGERWQRRARDAALPLVPLPSAAASRPDPHGPPDPPGHDSARDAARRGGDLERRNRYLSIIGSIAFALGDTSDEASALDRVTRLIARVLGAEAVQAYRAGSPWKLSVRSPDEPDAPHLPEHVMRRAGERAGYVAVDGAERAAASGLPDLGVPYALVPLTAKARRIGALAVFGAVTAEWGAEEQHLLLLIGREIGIGLENGRLYREALERADRERLLADSVRLMNGPNARERAIGQALEQVIARVGAEFAAVAAVRDGQLTAHTLASVAAEGSEQLAAIVDRLLPGLAAMVRDRWEPLVLGDDGEGTVSERLRRHGVGHLVVAPVITTRPMTVHRGRDDAGGEDPLIPERDVAGVLVVASSPESGWDAGRSEAIERLAGVLARRFETDELVRLQQRRIKELSGLAEIARLMQSGADADRLYAGFAQSLAALLPYEGLFIARLEETGGLLEVRAFAAGGRTSGPRSFDRSDASHPWFSLRTAHRWGAEDAPPAFLDAGSRSGVVIPMRPKGQALGAVLIALRSPARPDQLKIVEQAVEQLALALDSAALYRQATERASHIQALSNLARIVASVVDLREAFDAFAEEVRWLIPFERAVMLLIDDEGTRIEPYATYPEEERARRSPRPLAGSLVGSVIDAGEAVSLSRGDPRYAEYDWSVFGDRVSEVAAVPVRQGSRTTAIFALLHTGDGRYSEHDLEALGEVAGLLGVTIERLRLYERAEYSARHDLLTGLPNYRFLQERLGEMRAGTESRQGALMLLDLDSLKLFNDTLGHEAGDRVIQIVADLVRRNVRPADFVARTGGDEFVVVMEGVDAERAQEVASALHAALADAHREFPNAPCPIQVSIGIAMSIDGVGAPAELLHAADQAMYAAKFSGGHRTVFANPDLDLAVEIGARGRHMRLIDLAVQSCIEGASEEERQAALSAERSLMRVAADLELDDDDLAAMRLALAARVAARLRQPASPLNHRLADVLRRGLSGMYRAYARDRSAAVTALPDAAVATAWLQLPPPYGESLSPSRAAERVRARLGRRLPRELGEALERSWRSTESHSLRPPGRAA